jgi:hypothetical protein
MTSRVLETIEEYPALGTKSVNPKLDARKNMSFSKPPQSKAKPSFSRRNGQQNKGPNLYGQRVNGQQEQQPYRSGYNNRPNSQRAGTQQANPNPMNATQTRRDENPEINDTRFLQWTVSEYKEILRDNCHLLNVSSTFRPHSLTKFDSSADVKDDHDHDVMDIMAQWNKEYHHAQKVLNVCRSQFRLWLTKQNVVKNSGNQDVLERYNLDFNNFKTIAAQKQKPVMNPVKWFKKKHGDQSSQIYTPIELYITRIYSEEREFLKNVIQKFVELVESELPDDYDNTMPGRLGLMEFDFKSDDVQAWTSLYKNMKNKQKIIWPKLPPLCYFPYSNNPANPTKYGDREVQVSEDFETKNKEVYNIFKNFKENYSKWVESTPDKTQWKQNELGLRIWFHARAWLAFRKAIQSNLIKEEDKDAYMKTNRIQHEENKYLVLGSTMAFVLPAASRPSYLVSFESS